ncbi:hypothetical protein EKO04_004917 [Ascochyta lentis]|uniref:Uncharacterized protein n=1 Tax=Ascochyta lentis TaxID=205686 RepID=A0A8H7J4Y8_9PLEO|nr:hypothetical protein EKO04_004917 [Ascochyta lentis]
MSSSFNMISVSYTWGFLLFGAAALAFITSTAGKYLKSATRSSIKKRDLVVPEKLPEDAYYSISPLKDFDVDTEEPIKARPFKPKFHMTMAIENITLSEFIVKDKTYHERIKMRRKLLADEHHEVVGTNPKASPAVLEMYKWLTHTYLPDRFPTMFSLTPTGLLNKTTQETLPLSPTSATHALELMGSHIDNDFLFLLPSSAPEDDGKYRLEAFITCFPSGFNTRTKLGHLLAAIHGPVPHYQQKLERSMDKFFAMLPVGKIVRRWNWTISTSGDLFRAKGLHATPEQAARESRDVHLQTTGLRCERQTLHRLPESKAVVFAFKTYQYPIAQLRDEGSGEALCEAIDGVETGSVPGMAVYKRQVVWAGKVKAFLRGEIDVDA